MVEDVLALLKIHDYFRGVADEALQDVLSVARIRSFDTGEVIHHPEQPVSAVLFILRGRVKAVRLDAQGREAEVFMVQRGGQMGMLLSVLQEPTPIRAIALEPSTILEVDSERGLELTLKHSDLRSLWLRSYAKGLRKMHFGETAKRAPMLLGLIHETPASRGMAERLVSRLREIDEAIGVLSDSQRWRESPGLRFRLLAPQDRPQDYEEIRRHAIEWHDADRIVIDVDARTRPEDLERLLQVADRALYFVPASEAEAAAARLRKMNVAARGWRDKLSLAWLLDPTNTVGPQAPGMHELVGRDFKLAERPAGPEWGRSLGSGLERIVHDLRQARIGVALGGGAARGMSHLGVLKALELNGIVVDMIAGTSAGAMTGVVFASGLEADYSARRFAADLLPSWPFRRLPRGDHLFLLYKYRRGHFDPMLRKYLRDWRLEQLCIPCCSVTVDLVSGGPVVRHRGDATHAILESINLPVLSLPIVRHDQALIDGGLVNNIPADVLVSSGCNFVIAVSVTAKMERQFCDIAPGKPNASRKRPGTIQTILRSLLVQNHSLNAIGVRPADVVIAPDVTGFDLTAFMRATELAAVGEATAQKCIPTIQTLLNRLDPKLYRFESPHRKGDAAARD
jgi:predicted acylesterase/phospholipase RssA/CRP-like cAMP-binding protein